VRTYIRPLAPERFRVHLPTGIKDFNTLAQALDYAMETSRDLADAQARRAGASAVQVQMSRKDQIVDAGGADGGGFFLGVEIKAAAIGRPRLASNKDNEEMIFFKK
jgi:hypothetical protein